MIVKIVDNRSGNSDNPVWVTSEEIVISGVSDLRHTHKTANKTCDLTDLHKSIVDSAAMNFLTDGDGGFASRLNEPVGKKKNVSGEGKYIDWMYFNLTTRKDGQITHYDFITDKDVFLMGDDGQTIERYKINHL